MRDIDITSDIKEAIRGVEDFMERQIPFALAGGITDTAFDVRRRIVGSTYPEAFEVKNKRFPGVMFKVMDEAGAPLRGGVGATARKLRNTGEVEISVGDKLGRDYMVKQAEGGTKTSRSENLAVPVRPGDLRGASGRILARNKPRKITDKKKYFLLQRGGRKVAIMERRGKDTTAVYLFMQQAQIPKRFRFYEDAMDTSLRVFSGHLDTRLARAIRSSRFFPG